MQGAMLTAFSERARMASCEGASVAVMRRGLIVAALGLVLQGCTVGRLSYVFIDDPAEHYSCQVQTGALQRHCVMGRPVQASVQGTGNCSLLRIQWGDGQTSDIANQDFGTSTNVNYARTEHIYTGWPGDKRVVVEGVTNCAGTASADFTLINEVSPSDLRASTVIGLSQPVSTTCTTVPNRPPLRADTVVSITVNPTLQPTNYGCPFGGCVYDADGKPGSSAPSRFPFPSLREFSLVLRVGGDVYQGGMNTRFVTKNPGALEICVNDDNLSDNRGDWGLTITIDERHAK